MKRRARSDRSSNGLQVTRIFKQKQPMVQVHSCQPMYYSANMVTSTPPSPASHPSGICKSPERPRGNRREVSRERGGREGALRRARARAHRNNHYRTNPSPAMTCRRCRSGVSHGCSKTFVGRHSPTRLPYSRKHRCGRQSGVKKEQQRRTSGDALMPSWAPPSSPVPFASSRWPWLLPVPWTWSRGRTWSCRGRQGPSLQRLPGPG